jgi:hypothetical protein
VQIIANYSNIVISWTTNATVFALSQSASLVASVTWSPMTNGITVNGSINTVIINASSSVQYFRLIASP